MRALVDVMKVLRGPQGCPWDKKQTFDSLMSCLLEEVHEIMDSVQAEAYDKLQEELGDTLCIIAMVIAMGEQQGLFTQKTVINNAVKKMKRRHPHVFGKDIARTPESAHTLWHRAKSTERSIQERQSILDDLPLIFPALLRADKIQRRVARVGFDWPSLHGVIKKIEEEFKEVKHEIKSKRRNMKRVEEELGDVLFAVVNLGRTLHIDSETALCKTNNKFIKRFQRVEKQLIRQGKKLGNVSLKELDVLWEHSKNKR